MRPPRPSEMTALVSRLLADDPQAREDAKRLKTNPEDGPRRVVQEAEPMLKILFLCTGNSCRSQMAEGWARHLKGDQIEAYSAGIETHGLNPDAVRVMAEAGVDISGQRSKQVGRACATSSSITS